MVVARLSVVALSDDDDDDDDPDGVISSLMRLAKFSDNICVSSEDTAAAAAFRDPELSVNEALPNARAMVDGVSGPSGAGGAVDPKSDGAWQIRDRGAFGRDVAISGHAPPTSPPACSSPLRLGTMLAQSTLTMVLVARLDSSTHRRPLA